jgi:hypothetical protein
MERVVALQAAGLAAAGHDVTLVAAPGSAVPGVEVISPLDELPTQIGMATEEWRHVLGSLAGFVPDLQVTELGSGAGYLGGRPRPWPTRHHSAVRHPAVRQRQ